MTECSFCGGVEFDMQQFSEKITKSGVDKWVLMDSSCCLHCGEDVITTEQIFINEQRVRDAFEAQPQESGSETGGN